MPQSYASIKPLLFPSVKSHFHISLSMPHHPSIPPSLNFITITWSLSLPITPSIPPCSSTSFYHSISPLFSWFHLSIISPFLEPTKTYIGKGVDLINENNGFTVTWWYKHGQVNDHTVLIQNANDHNSKCVSTNNTPV